MIVIGSGLQFLVIEQYTDYSKSFHSIPEIVLYNLPDSGVNHSEIVKNGNSYNLRDHHLRHQYKGVQNLLHCYETENPMDYKVKPTQGEESKDFSQQKVAHGGCI